MFATIELSRSLCDRPITDLLFPARFIASLVSESLTCAFAEKINVSNKKNNENFLIIVLFWFDNRLNNFPDKIKF